MMADRPLTPNDLLPGDVLLHMGAGELSKLIAWVGDSRYSHAALVVRGGELIEAAASGVRHARLADRTRLVRAFRWIDVYRPLRPSAGDAAGVDAVLHAADAYLGRPYPMTSLLLLGVTCAVRNKLTDDPDLRVALRMALDLVVRNDTDKVVCSELVYRAFDEAATRPPHALRLPVETRAAPHRPMPAIDVEALIAECLDDYRRSLPAAPASRSLTAEASPQELAALLAQARDRLGLDDAVVASGDGYAPNPKTVLPADLEFSPGLREAGRLAMAG